jgi:hypothetical protein
MVNNSFLPDAEECFKPIIETINGFKLRFLTTSSSLYGFSKKEIRRALSNSRNLAKVRFNSMTKELDQNQKDDVYEECVDLLNGLKLDEFDPKAKLFFPQEYDILQGIWNEFLLKFPEKFKLEPEIVVSYKVTDICKATDKNNICDDLRDLHSNLIASKKIDGKITNWRLFVKLFSQGLESEKDFIDWIGDKGSCVEFNRALARHPKLKASIPKNQKPEAILISFFRCRGKNFDKSNFDKGKASGDNYNRIKGYVDSFLKKL